MPVRTARLIWPWWVRLSHALVATGILALWVLAYIYFETDAVHRALGYSILAIIVLRIVAAVFSNSSAARLSLPGRQEIQQHLVHLRKKNLPIMHGHNPLGQWAVYSMWSCVALLALTGWLSRTDTFWGEDWPVELHTWLSFCLMGLVVMHVMAVFWVSHISGQRLVAQMWHGREAVKHNTGIKP